jgi:hypothetical protein
MDRQEHLLLYRQCHTRLLIPSVSLLAPDAGILCVDQFPSQSRQCEGNTHRLSISHARISTQAVNAALVG